MENNNNQENNQINNEQQIDNSQISNNQINNGQMNGYNQMNNGQMNNGQMNGYNQIPNSQMNNGQMNGYNQIPNNQMNNGQMNGYNQMPNNQMNNGQMNGYNQIPNNQMNNGQMNGYNQMPNNQINNGQMMYNNQMASVQQMNNAPVYNPEIVQNVQVQNQALSNDVNNALSSKFSNEDINRINELSKNINLKDSVSIMSYGSAAQNKMVQFSENTLSNVMNKDLGSVGDAITGIVNQLKDFDVENETKGKGLFGLFKKATNSIDKLKTKFTNVEANIDGIVKVLENHQRNLLKDISMLDQMYNYNLEYLRELDIYIEAGKQKLNYIMSNDIPALESKAAASNSPEDVQMVRDLKDLANRFEKRIYDLELTRTISVQTIPQIRLVQNNNVMMTEKIQSTITNTIPLWKNQMVLAIGLHHSNEAAKAQRAVSDTTNELLRRNADMLKTSTIETAKESERGIVDLETLKHTNQQLISTLDEVMKIQNEGREKRQAAEVELKNIENELKNKILNIAQQQ